MHYPLLHWHNMGKLEICQSKLAFDGNHQMRHMNLDRGDTPPTHTPVLNAKIHDLDLKRMLVDVKNSHHNIDTKIDLLTNCINWKKKWMDKHNSHLDHLERCTYGTEDLQAATGEHLLHVDKNLEVIKHKNEDSEACSRRYNICIIDIPKSTTDKMEDYVEHILLSLFDDTLLWSLLWSTLTMQWTLASFLEHWHGP
ncbi:hypothetical protein NDU88_005574 [Pleurodeles waltl]|uniref:Uncharacterized protein n=1 Tax=Pleurodeles waltl TaxID=8319 RepID=A0AAV7WBV9_PLEWA|nr:hypothetical protein NDU88_005574 [Pleurodeles waltl]